MKKKNALIIFAKKPEWGKVKTRLAVSIGNDGALAVYEKLVTYTQQIVLAHEANSVVYYADQTAYQEDGWKGIRKEHQTVGDLGLRMLTAFRKELVAYSKVCIIGTDCAELTTDHITTAFHQLDYYDYVLGPANDGGYYLLGMKKPYDALFQGIDWSTSSVLRQTMSIIKSLGQTCYLLPELIDVDTLEDWELVRKNFH